MLVLVGVLPNRSALDARQYHKHGYALLLNVTQEVAMSADNFISSHEHSPYGLERWSRFVPMCTGYPK